MIGRIAVIGLGNRYRRDDGVGVAAAMALGELALPGVEVATDIMDPLTLLEVWSGARLAILVDAAVATAATAGRIRCCNLDQVLSAQEPLSSHSIDIGRTYALGRELHRIPAALQIYAVDVADTGHGTGLSARVELALPDLVSRVAAEIAGVAEVSA
ncbi:hydrogenase maturation protease [Mycobacterium camsae]|uniref:hydrogenase maturation protease n=1 Tax=Mycobacterium gordonae TaxID=1778 RepID=UPI00198108C3|nr:hydrogenase maturation protease [Mycobacterium gordonae]